MSKDRKKEMDTRANSEQTEFSRILKYQREVRGWSQVRMADELRTTPNRISAWERGGSLPAAYFREKLCTLLQMNVVQLGLLPNDILSTSDSISREDSVSKSDLVHEAVQSEPPLSARPPCVSDSVSREDDVSRLGLAHEAVQLSPSQPAHYPPNPLLSRKPLLVSFFLLGSILLIGSVLLAPLSTLFKSSQPNPYALSSGRLVLNDPLRDQSRGVNWQEGSNDQQARCLFKNGAYTVVQPLAGLFHPCVAQLTEYQNFAYEVEMTIHTGEFGGILFRCEDSFDMHCYLFRLHVDGSYWLYRFVDRSSDHARLLDTGTIPAFQKGEGKTNRVAVVALNDALTLYANGQKVATLHDAGYTHGQIGVLAGSMDQGPSEATFQHAKVWT